MMTTFKSISRITCVAALSLLFSVGLFGQNALNVTCVDESGSAIRGAKVFLQNLRDPKVDDKKSNRDGLVEFKKLEEGVYRVWARNDGMSPGLEDLLWLRGGADSNVTLTLKPGNPEQALYFEDATVLDRANQLTQEAVNSFGTNSFDEAESKLTEALELYPSSPFAHQNLGLVALRNEDWDRGEHHLQMAADYMEIFAVLGQTQLAPAREQVLSAIATIPLQRLAVEANGLMSERKYSEALPKFEEMKAMAPNNPDVYYNMALALAHADMVSEAKESISKALELRPADSASVKLRDQILQIEKSGQSLRAKEIVDSLQNLYDQREFQAVIDRSKESEKEIPEESRYVIWRLRGQAQLNTRDYPGAIVSYRQAGAAVTGEEKAEILQELAVNLLNAERYAEAFTAYADYYQAASTPADEGFYALGNTLSNKGKAEVAGELFQRVLDINPEHPDAHYSLGMHYFYDKNDRENAKKLLQRFVEIGTDESKLSNAKNVLIVMEKTQ